MILLIRIAIDIGMLGLVGTAHARHWRDGDPTRVQLLAAVSVHLSFIWLAPVIALYFIAIVFKGIPADRR